MNDNELIALLDELDAAQKKAVDLPYYVGSDRAEDCPEHHNSGLALIDTGRGGDWPIARLCEWHTATFVEQVCNAYPTLSAAMRQHLERFRLCKQVQKHGEHSSVTCACIEPALRQRLTNTAQPMGLACVWYEDDWSESVLWETSCGQDFQFNDGGPKENSFRFCYFCGKPLKELRRSDAEETDPPTLQVEEQS